jgi:FHS family L-fucose permease-like MFS transporter
MKNIDPPKILMLFGVGGALASIGAVIFPGMMGLISLVGISVFMSIMFPTIYGIALKDMGDEVKIGSAGLVMAIVGGALMPIAQAAILDLGGDGFNDLSLLGYIPEINLSFILPAICLAFVGYYGYTNIKRLTNV